MFGYSILQLVGISITALAVGYLIYSILQENRFKIAIERRTPFAETEPEKEAEPSELISLTYDYSCYECMNYNFHRRYCMEKNQYLYDVIFYKPGTKALMEEKAANKEQVMRLGEYKECERHAEPVFALLYEYDPESIFVERGTTIIMTFLALIFFTIIYIFSAFVEELPILEWDLVHFYAALFWINAAIFSYVGILSMGNEYFRRGLISPIDYNIPVIGNLIGGFGAAIAQILYLYEIHDLAYLGFILIFLGISFSLKDVGDIDVSSIPYEGKILLELAPLTEEEVQSSKESPYAILFEKPHAPDHSSNNQLIDMDITAINNIEEDKAVILSYVSPCLEPQSDSVTLIIPPYHKAKKTFVAFTNLLGTYYVSFRIADGNNNVLGEWNELLTIQPETKGYIFRFLAFLGASLFSIIQAITLGV